MTPDPPRVVIVGAGFGGLYAARTLKHANDVQVTVIDRRNHHLFQPLLYQVATAGLSPSDIAYPIRGVLSRYTNTRIFQAEAVAVDMQARTVRLADDEVGYEYLILATGARHSYFGHPEWEAQAPGLKSVVDALEIRGRILGAFERAERESDEDKRRVLLTFIIVGGGPTGVELAGAIAEIAFHVMVHDFRQIDPREARIILVQASPRVLPDYPQALSIKAERSLRKLGIEVRTNSLVTSVEPGSVKIGDERVRAATVLWAAGVTASPLARSLDAALDQTGRVLVEPDLSLPGHPEVFVIGDLAACIGEKGEPLPGLAPVAIQQGRHAACNVLRRIQGLGSDPFHYTDRGKLATIGRASAVADFGTIRLSGLLAWLTWLFVHIFFLIGFHNRVIVFLKWTWMFVTLQHSSRVIINETEKEASLAP